jgi:hypothetical protein
MVQYYRDMWQKHSEMLAPLTDLVGECGETTTTKKNKTKKKPWRWESIHQQAFDNVKATIAKEVVLAYPDFTKLFEIYTDASTMQLGSVITQASEVQNKMIFIGHQISSCHVPVVRSFFIYFKIISSS